MPKRSGDKDGYIAALLGNYSLPEDRLNQTTGSTSNKKRRSSHMIEFELTAFAYDKLEN